MSGLIGSAGSKSGVIGRKGGEVVNLIVDDGYSYNLGWSYNSGVDENETYISKDELNLAVDDVYGGLNLLIEGIPVRCKYFDFEFDYKGNSGSNHQGCFWGNQDINALFGGDSTGYRTTHASTAAFDIRDNQTNSQQTTWNPPHSPADNSWHHQRVLAPLNSATIYVYIDGVQRLSGSYIPSAPGNVGLVAYAGTTDLLYKNITFKILD